MPTYLVKLLRAGVWDGNTLTVVADSAEEAAHQFVNVDTLADLGRPEEACAQVQSRRRQRPVTFYNVDFNTVRESHSFASGQRVQFTWGPHERKTAEVIQTRYKDGSAYVDVRLDDGGRTNNLRAETFALAPPSGSVMGVSARGMAGNLVQPIRRGGTLGEFTSNGQGTVKPPKPKRRARAPAKKRAGKRVEASAIGRSAVRMSASFSLRIDGRDGRELTITYADLERMRNQLAEFSEETKRLRQQVEELSTPGRGHNNPPPDEDVLILTSDMIRTAGDAADIAQPEVITGSIGSKILSVSYGVLKEFLRVLQSFSSGLAKGGGTVVGASIAVHLLSDKARADALHQTTDRVISKLTGIVSTLGYWLEMLAQAVS